LVAEEYPPSLYPNGPVIRRLHKHDCVGGSVEVAHVGPNCLVTSQIDVIGVDAQVLVYGRTYLVGDDVICSYLLYLPVDGEHGSLSTEHHLTAQTVEHLELVDILKAACALLEEQPSVVFIGIDDYLKEQITFLKSTTHP